MKYAFLMLPLAISTPVFAGLDSVTIYNDTRHHINIQYEVCKNDTRWECESRVENIWNLEGEKRVKIYLNSDQKLEIRKVKEIDINGDVVKGGVSSQMNHCIARGGQTLALNLDRTTGVLCTKWG